MLCPASGFNEPGPSRGAGVQKLNSHIERIERWREAFSDGTTGIHGAVYDLIQKYTAFQTTVRIVRLAEKRQDRERVLNHMLFDLISEGYWSSLLLGTRRLLDGGALKGSMGVYSIRSVVRDVEASRPWLNRKVYVGRVHRAPYDIEQLQQEMNRTLTASKGPQWVDDKLHYSDIAHRYFDALSGVAPPDRRLDDLIDPAVFARIEARLKALDRIVDHVNTHVAHAGNRESRSQKRLDNFGVSDARATVKQLTEIANLTGNLFANEGNFYIGGHQTDQFEGLDQPVINSDEIVKLEEQWHEMHRDIEKWRIDVAEL